MDEFLRLCKKISAEPVMVVWIGPRSRTPANPEHLQDVLDLIEY